MEEWAQIARELMLGLLQRLGIETDVESLVKDGDLIVKIKSDEGGILIGKHGRTLESLQTLLTRMLNKQARKPVRIVLDIANYKEKRTESLRKMAGRLAGNVKRSGKTMTIGPFNAFERRIIHLAIKEEPSVRTESIGEGELKRIEIIPTLQQRKDV